MRRILCLKFPGWPLQRLIAARPELRANKLERAIVIHRCDPRRGDVVRLCSARAWTNGVRLGMPLAEATALFRNESEVVLSPHDPTADLKLLTKIATWCERYSPLVGWETIPGGRKDLLALLPAASEPEALYLDITGIGRLFGGEEELAKDIFSEVTRRGLVARVGIAETIGAAWAASGAEEQGSRGAGEPSFVRILAKDGIENALAPFSITTLRLSDENVATLHELGVQTIEQLLALPRQGLSARFGPGLMLRIDQALGHAAELIRPLHPLPAYQAEWLLEHPTQRREEVESILQHLVERLAGQLSQRQEGATRLTCRLDAAGHAPLCFGVGLYRPTASSRHLFELMYLQLERLRLPGAVGRIGVAAVLTSPLETHQAQLFEDVSLRTSRAQALLLDRLSSRLGAQAVLRPLLISDPLPERGVKLLSATDSQGNRRSKKSRQAACSTARVPAPSHRPLFLLSPPQAIETTAIAPDGPPVRLLYQQRLERVARHWGPERVETAWWRDRSVRRDYYRVETSSGRRFWVFRELHTGRWFLHGVFE